jgi:hypothetical protein
LGRRTSHFLAYCDERHFWNKESQHWAHSRCAEYPRALVVWSTGAKPILGGRTFRATRCKSNAAAALRELQHAAWVVSNVFAHNHLELRSKVQYQMDSPNGRRSRKDSSLRKASREHLCAVFSKRGAPGRFDKLVRKISDAVSIPKEMKRISTVSNQFLRHAGVSNRSAELESDGE